MKSLRLISLPLAGLAMMAVLSGCGDTASPTGLESGLDTTPPPAPASVALALDGSGLPALSWSASAAPDVATYSVYVYSPSPDRDNAYILVDDVSASETFYTLPAVSSITEATYRVKAVDSSGNRSAFSVAAQVSTGPTGGGGGGDLTPIDLE